MIDFLRSKIATLVVLVLALVAQLPHAAEVFMQAGNVHGWWAVLHGGAYAMALELAVLLFVVQGHRNASYAFAGVSVLVNLAYYAQRVQLFSVHGLSAWLISVALPVAIALYSHAVADAQDAFDFRAWLRTWRPKPAVQPSVESLQPVTEPMHPVQKCVEVPVQFDDEDAQPEPRTVAAQLRSEGLSIAQISEQLNVHRNTVGKWLSKKVSVS